MNLNSLIAGITGGSLVALLAIALFLTLVSQPSIKTVTVQETSVVAAGVGGGGVTPLSARQIYARAVRGVVFVSASGIDESQSASEYLRGEGGEQGTATGSGFEIDRTGTILTNWHVVQGASRITVGVDDAKTVQARLIGEDRSEDLALLRIPTAGLTLDPIALGDSSRVSVGDSAYAIGNPFGLGGTLTTGVISALGRQIQAPGGATITGALQTDAPINPGNSGGPLLNDRGEAIGVNSQIETSDSGGGSIGIAFAIPIDAVKRALPMLGTILLH